jgi:hypothetical protein
MLLDWRMDDRCSKRKTFHFSVFLNVFNFRNKFYDETFVCHARKAMRFFVFAVCEGEVIDFMTTTTDAFGKRDIGILHEAVKLGVVEFVVFVKRIDLLHVDDPDALVHGFFDAVFRHPATTSGIEYTEGKDEAEAET